MMLILRFGITKRRVPPMLIIDHYLTLNETSPDSYGSGEVSSSKPNNKRRISLIPLPGFKDLNQMHDCKNIKYGLSVVRCYNKTNE
jgi:hypothetical protein